MMQHKRTDLRVFLCALLCGAGILTPQGCSRGSENTDVTVFAAASLTGVITEASRLYEQEHPGALVVCSFAGSQVLAAQLLSGARADVFLSADSAQMDRVSEMVGAPAAFASGRLVVIALAPAGYADALAALAGAERVSVAGPEVPAGRYARAVCERLGVWEAVGAKSLSEEESARGVLVRVLMGSADAGIVYATDAKSAPAGDLAVYPLPEVEGVKPVYLGAVCKGSSDPAAARAFLDFLTSDGAARAIFEAHGFGAP